MKMRNWIVKVWDGSTIREYTLNGTYGQVANICNSSYPASYIWSIT